jgi:hypothetical protein
MVSLRNYAGKDTRLSTCPLSNKHHLGVPAYMARLTSNTQTFLKHVQLRFCDRLSR